MKAENNNLQFKTNINCSGCVAKVTPFLNDTRGINQWEVNTENKDKILTVQTDDGISAEKVIQKVQEAGFKIELVSL
ncbi:heavy-metal-associated domain-containing protein [Flavobacterium aquicola]|uniref:Copper chaperone CopZ n=1 Tax=Flavobacterium aquicola TaxID=1682742 RepID=A0A3E0EUR0_9FLAO|nr:heavy metal-associated domain-containing protein [Flavobacterium aquicola]REH00837.1 copper chaperone CopZ [Flavobacterium aquicola]